MALIVALALSWIATAASAQTAVDPKTLIGQWSGTWIERSEQKSGGRYYFTISKVEGNKVHCTGQFDVGRVIPFVATLNGNQIRFVGTANVIELTVTDTRMDGTLSGTRNVIFNLTKE